MARFSDSLTSSRAAARLLLGLALVACFALVLHGAAHFEAAHHPECPACQIVGKSASAANEVPVAIASPDWVRGAYLAEPERVRALSDSGRPFPRGPPA